MLSKIFSFAFGGITKLTIKSAKHLLLRPTAMMMLALLGVVACSGENNSNGKYRYSGGHRNPVNVSSGSPYGGTSKPTRVKIGSAYDIKGETYQPRFEPEYAQTGMASWYGPGFHGRSTASGEKYDQYQMTAAHRTLPLPSLVRVTRVDNGHSVIVRVNDRGPFHGNRIIDLSKAAANDLKMIGSGVAEVDVEYLHDETMDYIAELGLDAPQEMQLASGSAYSPVENIPAIKEVIAPAVTTIKMLELEPPVAKIVQAKPVMNVAWQQPVAKIIYQKNGQQEKIVESFAPIKIAQTTPFQTSSQSLEQIIAQKTLQAQTLQTSQTPVVAMLENSGSQFRVQTAAFSSLSNAQKHAKTLQPIAKPLISEIAKDGATLYRVSFPAVEDYDVAMVMLKKTKQMGYSDARLMVE